MKKFIATILFSSALLIGCASNEKKAVETKLEPVSMMKSEAPEQEQIDSHLFQSNVEGEVTSTGVKVRVALINNNSVTGNLLFPSSQQIEILIKNQHDQIVYQFSNNQSFTQEIETLVLNSKKAHVWEAEWRVNPSMLEEGIYTIEGNILVQEVNGYVLNEEERETFKDIKAIPISVADTQNSITDLDVQGIHGNYQIQGKYNGDKKLFYSVEDGHNSLIEEVPVDLKDDGAGSRTFYLTVQVAQNSLPKNGVVTIQFYTKDENSNRLDLEFHPLEYIH